MKFILVNHRSPLTTATCTECAEPLGTGYLRYQTKSLFMPWLGAGRGDQMPAATWPATPYAASYELIASFAAATCWYSISLAKAALRVSELMATQSIGPFSGRG